MTFAVARSDLQTILNRRDLTTDQANVFLTKGLLRINREVRCPPQENIMVWVADGSPYMPVPSDYLELISLFTQDTQAQDNLRRTSLQHAIRLCQGPGYPLYFHRQANKFILAPCPPVGTKVVINYYQNGATDFSDGAENWVTITAPDLLTYASLSRAADFFLDDRKALFESTYQEIRQGLMDMATQDELRGACIAPAYTMDF